MYPLPYVRRHIFVFPPIARAIDLAMNHAKQEATREVTCVGRHLLP